jgi:RHS repeat-associated protein
LSQNNYPQQFVRDLYLAFLRHEPDEKGWAWWPEQVGTNWQNKQAVMNDFANTLAYEETAKTLYRETFWLIGDHLGTPRLIAERTGKVEGGKRRDMLPFGEELTVGGRDATNGYTPASVRVHYTSYERDVETGLDYAQARYYGSGQGRFISVDPLLTSAKPNSPQSWNRYAYVLNRPLHWVDPLGLYPIYWDGKHTWSRYQKKGFSLYDGPNRRIKGNDGYWWNVSSTALTRGGRFKTVANNSAPKSPSRQPLSAAVQQPAPQAPSQTLPVTQSPIPSPCQQSDNDIGFSAGVLAGGNAGGGLLLVGGSGELSVSGGSFVNFDRGGQTTTALMLNGGGNIGLAGFGRDSPGNFSYPDANTGKIQAGAWAGVGGGLWFSDATSPSQLQGTFKSLQLHLPIGSLQMDYGGGIHVFSASIGKGGGIGVASKTITTEILFETTSIPCNK